MMRVPLNEIGSEGYDRLVYNGRPFTGVAVEVDSDGVLLGESTYRDGVQDGLERAFWEDGSVRAEDHYRFGILVERREWHRNGQLAYEAHNDRSGRRLSEQRWNDDGSPQS